MNFLEAVQALKDGKCEGIKKGAWIDGTTLVIGLDGRLTFIATSYIPFVTDFLADWQLVGEKPQVEEVEVVRWMVRNNVTGNIFGNYDDKATAQLENSSNQYTYHEVILHYTRPVPRKVKRREEVGIYGGGFVASRTDSTVDIPKNAKLYAEWEEVEP